MLYAYPYLLLLLAYGMLAVLAHAFKGQSVRTMYVEALALALYVFFFGFRGYVLYDWSSYYREFSVLPSFGTLFTMPLKKWAFEPGFTIFCVALKSIYANYFFMQFTCAIINMVLLARFFRRYTDNMPLAFVMYLTMGGFVLSIDLMRNSISIFLFINAIELIVKKRLLPFVAVCAFAGMFHSSAWAYIPLYFVINRSYNRNLLLAIFVVANAIYVLHIPVLKSVIMLFVGILAPSARQYIDYYLTMDATTGSVLSIGYLERLLTGVLMFCYYNKLKDIRPGNNVFVNSLFIYLVLFLGLSEFKTISSRVANLFVYGYWIVWMDFLKCFYYRNNRYLFIGFLSIYCMLKTFSGYKFALSQYNNILIHVEDYDDRYLYFLRHYNEVK